MEGWTRSRAGEFKFIRKRWVGFPPPGFFIYEEVEQDVGSGFTNLADTPFSSNDDLRLYSKLIKDVKGHSFNLGVNLGQLNQTTSMLASNLSKLGHAALALKRGNFAAAARQLGARPRGTRLKGTDVSGRWLELQYGWMPLIGDSYEAMKAFEAISQGPRKKTFRTSIKSEVKGNCAQAGGANATADVQHKKYIQYEMSEELDVQRQLGLLDPASVLWELTPWSFVIDWFIPIGTYLDVLNQIPNFKGRFLFTTVSKVSGVYDWSLPPGVDDRGTVADVKDGLWHFDSYIAKPFEALRYTKMTRAVGSSIQYPPLPSFNSLKGSLSAARIKNAIALAYSRFA
jgi:hypothetical protein